MSIVSIKDASYAQGAWDKLYFGGPNHCGNSVNTAWLAGLNSVLNSVCAESQNSVALDFCSLCKILCCIYRLERVFCFVTCCSVCLEGNKVGCCVLDLHSSNSVLIIVALSQLESTKRVQTSAEDFHFILQC